MHFQIKRDNDVFDVSVEITLDKLGCFSSDDGESFEHSVDEIDIYNNDSEFFVYATKEGNDLITTYIPNPKTCESNIGCDAELNKFFTHVQEYRTSILDLQHYLMTKPLKFGIYELKIKEGNKISIGDMLWFYLGLSEIGKSSNIKNIEHDKFRMIQKKIIKN